MFEKNGKERLLFSEYYKMCETYWNATTEAEINEAINKVDDFRSKFEDGTNFAAYLGMGLMERLKRKDL